MLSVMSFEVGTSCSAQSVPYMEGNALCCCRDSANLCICRAYTNTKLGKNVVSQVSTHGHLEFTGQTLRVGSYTEEPSEQAKRAPPRHRIITNGGGYSHRDEHSLETIRYTYMYCYINMYCGYEFQTRKNEIWKCEIFYTHARTHAHTHHTHARMHTHTTRTHARMHTHMHTQTHTHTHAHTHTHTHTHLLIGLLLREGALKHLVQLTLQVVRVTKLSELGVQIQ